MDGGKMTRPESLADVEKNAKGILSALNLRKADIYLLQEVDLNSYRSHGMNQGEYFRRGLGYAFSTAFAYNYKCPFVPIPLPPMGKMEAGIATLTSHLMGEDAERISLPCPFSWPVSAANLKRCLLVTRIDVEGTDKQLVLVNLHLEAYDDGEGKIAQTKLLMQILQEEYEKGNFVIAGGDFNQTFPGGLDAFPIKDTDKWMPGVLDSEMLPEGWQFACDSTTPTCRLLDQPYNEACQLYLIDGFILSPNVQLDGVQTVDLGFEYSDHNPVRLNVTLLP